MTYLTSGRPRVWEDFEFSKLRWYYNTHLNTWESSGVSFSCFATFWFFDFLLPFVDWKGCTKIGKSSCEIRGGAFFTFLFSVFFCEKNAKKLKIKNWEKMSFFYISMKWESSGVSFSCFAILDFLDFWHLLLIENCAQKFEKSNCQIRGGGAFLIF